MICKHNATHKLSIEYINDMNLTSAENIVLLLVRISLHKQKEDLLISSKVDYSKVDWNEVFTIAKEQGVAAITLDAIQTIYTIYPNIDLQIPKPIKTRWISLFYNIENNYNKQYRVATELSNVWAKHNIKTICLKGLVFSQYYPIPCHRECGDFDCYLFDKYEEGNQIAQNIGAQVDLSWYKHSQISYKGVMVENHRYCVTTRNGKEAKLLDRYFKTHLHINSQNFLPNSCILIPSVEFNTLFLIYHSCAHFLSEGISLRHIIDWGLLIQKEQNNIKWTDFYAMCKKLHYTRFVNAITAIAVDYLGITLTNSSIEIDRSYSDKILYSILRDNDKVHSSGEGKWLKRLHLINNIFKYRWKYKEIYQHSFLKKFFTCIIGYIFKTDRFETNLEN